MDIWEALLINSSRDLLTITAFLSHDNKRRLQISKKKIQYVESFSGKLRRIIKPHKIWSTFHTQSALRKILCKQKDRVAREDKNNIAYKIVCSNCKAVYFGESKRCLKSCSGGNKRHVTNCDYENNKIEKHCWEVECNFS